MKTTRALGTSGVNLTTVGLGTWAMGGGGWAYAWGPQDDRESIQTVHAAVEAGINWVDTAAVYGLGHSEEVVGRAIRGRPERPLVATKCSLIWDGRGRISSSLRAHSVRAECDASLKRLGLEVIDLYQIHWPNPQEEIEEGWAAIGGLIGEGKVRLGGVSNFSVEQLDRIRPLHPVTSLQPPYSMLARGVEQDLLTYCGKHNIGVVAYSPMQKGLLTGKVTAEWVAGLAEDDHRKRDPMFNEPRLTEILGKVEALKAVAGRNKLTLSQLAVAWVLRRPEVTAAIVGARRPDQIRQTSQTMGAELPVGDLEEIDSILS